MKIILGLFLLALLAADAACTKQAVQELDTYYLPTISAREQQLEDTIAVRASRLAAAEWIAGGGR